MSRCDQKLLYFRELSYKSLFFPKPADTIGLSRAASWQPAMPSPVAWKESHDASAIRPRSAPPFVTRGAKRRAVTKDGVTKD